MLSTAAIQRQLFALGHNKDEVAATLEGLGIKGKRHGGSTPATYCPLAVFVHRLINSDYQLAHGFGTGTVFTKETTQHGFRLNRIANYDGGRACDDFARAFDAGLYPALDINPEK